MKYPKSIMTDDMNHCYLCGSMRNIQVHHIYGGYANRKLSTKYGLVVPLCYDCHLGTHGVHFDSKKMRYLRILGQERFEEVYPSLSFSKIFGYNFIAKEDTTE